MRYEAGWLVQDYVVVISGVAKHCASPAARDRIVCAHMIDVSPVVLTSSVVPSDQRATRMT